jgi:hypothetical protein
MDLGPALEREPRETFALVEAAAHELASGGQR